MAEPQLHRGQPIVVFNRGASLVPAWPGAMIAPADATRVHLVIQASGWHYVMIYPTSGSPNPLQVGIGLVAPCGYAEFNDEEDPDLVVAEWWAASFTPGLAPNVAVTEEIYR